MSLLKKAQNNIAYGKVGIYGTAGTGKTRTAAEIAIGLHKKSGSKKPVAMFDTEPGAAFITPLFEKAGIELLVCQSRSLKDLMEFMQQAEKDCSIAIIDSVTHVWRNLQDQFLKEINEKRRRQNKQPVYSLEFHHWKSIKDKWGKFTDSYLSSKLHCIVCGRSGSIYEYQKNDANGKKELITTGTKMATEKELGYEPSLLIEMEIEKRGNERLNKAVVVKDRSDKLNGKEFFKPTFKTFEPHFDFINIGGKHFDSIDASSEKEIFKGEDIEEGFTGEKRQREIWCEEIKGLLVENAMDGASKEAKEKRVKILQEVFDTASWTKVESSSSSKIKEGFEKMKEILKLKKEAA